MDVKATIQAGRDSGSATKLKVFLSYSRRDGAFAEELLAALELLGFDAYLDKEDIAPGEPWEERLGSLIRLADTVVFIISPNSLTSQHCAWEVEETVRAGKRLVPVILTEPPDGNVPEQLRKLNYVYFTNGQSFSKGLGELARALRADAGWIREHTRYGELANRWMERNKPAALLLRSTDLDDAERWTKERPADAPEISANQQAYIEASSLAATEELAAKAKLRWRMMAALALATFALALFAGFSGYQWLAAETAKESLAATNARLERKLALRAAPRGYMPYDVPAGWFQVATSYAGAVAFVEKRTDPDRLLASGVLVEAHLLNPSWDNRPVFVTATFSVAKDSSIFSSAMTPTEAQIVILGPKNERRKARLGAILWQSDSLGVSVSSIEDNLPPEATAIKSANTVPVALSNLEILSPADVSALFDDRAMLKINREPRPIVFIGNLEGRNEVAISISHLLGALTVSRDSNATPSPVGESPGIAPAPVARQIQPDLVYTHGTLPGGSGSPIFDAATGDLIGIHLLGFPCARGGAVGQRCSGAGTSFTRLISSIRGR